MIESLTMMAILLFGLSLVIILLVFCIYPLLLWLVSSTRRSGRAEGPAAAPSVSVLIAVRNGEAFIAEKIQNTLDLNYPADRLEVVVWSDGSTDRTEEIVRSFRHPRVGLHASACHDGKTEALNRGVARCRGEIVVFSDADALLAPDAVRGLVRHYADASVGGVCGQRVLREKGLALRQAQSRYIRFDSMIKGLENRLGRITSNDGKLYSIRRDLFSPIPPAVTDDLYLSLAVIAQGYRFLFEPQARAFICAPSRSPSHEIERRRRIVSRSLRGIFIMRRTLDPFRYGAFSVGLLVNKVLRRLLPIALLVLFLTTAVLSQGSPWVAGFWMLQGTFYLLATLYPALARIPGRGAVARAASVPFYFCVGNYGTLLGVTDFLRGKTITRWNPHKTG